MAHHSPIPENESDRLLALAELDVDYADFKLLFQDLNKLVAKITGSEISLINLIDHYTQWSISNFGIDVDQLSRDESVCQYTIMHNDFFEVKNLAEDERFKDKPYVNGPLALKYYLGIPLKTDNGQNIGALCVMDKEPKEIGAEQRELLQIIAQDVVNRLQYYHNISLLKKKLNSWETDKKKIAHDIRSPLAGILSVSQVILDHGTNNDPEEILEFIKLINQSASTLLTLSDDFFEGGRLDSELFSLKVWKSKLLQFYGPQAQAKNINLQINFDAYKADVPIPKENLLQLSGNLISNAIKHTATFGSVQVRLDVRDHIEKKLVQIKVADSSLGFDDQFIKELNAESADFISDHGFAVVKRLVAQMNGKFTITSEEHIGVTAEVKLTV